MAKHSEPYQIAKITREGTYNTSKSKKTQNFSYSMTVFDTWNFLVINHFVSGPISVTTVKLATIEKIF